MAEINFSNFSWYKPQWCLPSTTHEIKSLLKDCAQTLSLEASGDVQDIIKKSRSFPIVFPINSIRLQNLKSKRPLERLKANILSTYPIIHERVLLLMAHFLAYKRKYGSNIEQELYKDMSIVQLVDRLLKKRAVTFMGKNDRYRLLSGKDGEYGWEAVGTKDEKSPLLLADCLSYDEIKLSALLYVTGPTECINDGDRRNVGIVSDKPIEEHAIIIGLIGPRFKKINRMEYEDIVITENQNRLEKGYGEGNTNLQNNESIKRLWRRLWSDFYQVSSNTFNEINSHVKERSMIYKNPHADKYVHLPRDKAIFDNEVYYKRLSIMADCALLEADNRAAQNNQNAFLNIIGCGLGVWMISNHQSDVYVLTFLERIQCLLNDNMLNHLTDVNFAYIMPSGKVLAQFTNEGKPKLLLKSKNHPKGGVNIQIEDRNPSSKLLGDHAGKLLVMTYPWDGNAHPGNEFWLGKLKSSGDPAAACSTQVSELHNAHINSAVSGSNLRVVGKHGILTLPEYIKTLALD